MEREPHGSRLSGQAFHQLSGVPVKRGFGKCRLSPTICPQLTGGSGEVTENPTLQALGFLSRLAGAFGEFRILKCGSWAL
jgi:hypothetical protein